LARHPPLTYTTDFNPLVMRPSLLTLPLFAVLATTAQTDTAPPALHWQGLNDGHPVLTVDAAAGTRYAIESSSDLRNWQTQVEAAATVPATPWIDPAQWAGGRRFYRAHWLGLGPLPASDPMPAHEANEVGLTTTLTWTAAGDADSHAVYFGTDYPAAWVADVRDSQFDPGPLSPNTTYYWRVDSRNAQGLTTGQVWRFTTAPQAAGVSYVGAGEPIAAASAITPQLPDNIQYGDILILFLQTAGPRIYVEDTNGGTWLALARGTASPQSTGSGSNEVHLTAYYARYNGRQGNPTTNHSGDHQLGVILAFRGVVAAGVPWDGVSGNTRESATTATFTPGAVTSVPNTLVVGAIATALPAANQTNNFGGWTATNANLHQLEERIDFATAAGKGGALGIVTAGFAPSGESYNRINATLSVPSSQAMFSVALRPEVLPGLITAPWPADGATWVGGTAELRWSPSTNASSRDIHFGTSPAVTYRASLTGNTFDPGPLQPATTYYWRVDEKNALGTTQGQLHSFTTAPAGMLPQLAGMTTANAARELLHIGGEPATVDHQFSDSVAPGVVISHQPAVGTLWQPGTVVHLLRSRGPESGVVVFPNGPDSLKGEALPVHRNVSLVRSNAGTLLAFTGHRPNGSEDEDDMDVHLRRSTDGGETWGPVIVVADDGMNPSKTQVAVVLPSGRIMLFWLWNAWIPAESFRTTRQVFVTHSDDDGLTWSPHRNITGQVYRSNWTWYGLGPGPAFVKQRPPNAGRLIIPARHGVRGAPGQPHIIFSDDNGETFQLGGELDSGNESTAVEQSDGSILFNARLSSIDHRYAGISYDGGLSFPYQFIDYQLPGAGACQASLLEHSFNPLTGKSNILFSNPDDINERINGTIKLSEQDGNPGTWVRKFRYSDPAPAFSGYSDIAVMNTSGDIGIVWEFGSNFSKPARWDGGVKFRAISFDQISQPIE
jgi:sialidase-1